MLYCGTVRHSVAVSSGCPSSTAGHILLDTAQMWRVEPQFLELIPDLCRTCLYVPCAHKTQRTTCVLFTREQEILQSCNKNPLPGHSYSCRTTGQARVGSALYCSWIVRVCLRGSCPFCKVSFHFIIPFIPFILLSHKSRWMLWKWPWLSPELQRKCCTPWRVILAVTKPSAARDGIRKAKAQMEVNLARNAKN